MSSLAILSDESSDDTEGYVPCAGEDDLERAADGGDEALDCDGDADSMDDWRTWRWFDQEVLGDGAADEEFLDWASMEFISVEMGGRDVRPLPCCWDASSAVASAAGAGKRRDESFAASGGRLGYRLDDGADSPVVKSLGDVLLEGRGDVEPKPCVWLTVARLGARDTTSSSNSIDLVWSRDEGAARINGSMWR